MKDIINSSKQINADTVSSDNFIKEISATIEVNKENIVNNDKVFKNIEDISNNFKQSVI